MLNYRGISPAGNRWQSELIRSLERHGLQVRVLGQRYEQRWPVGSMWPGKAEDTPDDIDVHLAEYFNAPIFREYFLYNGFLKGYNSIVNRHGKPALVLSYNPYSYHGRLARFAHNRDGVPWVPIVADFHDPGDDWKIFLPTIKESIGSVFLSSWAYKKCPLERKLHLDGGVTEVRYDQSFKGQKKKFRFLYTGAVSLYKGIDLLLEAFKGIPKNLNAELIICGKLATRSEGREILRLIRGTPNVEYLGVISEDRLCHESTIADAFVNPRPPGIVDHDMNFPSKILENLSWCKPVISTITKGISPEYQRILLQPRDQSVVAFAEQMQRAVSMSTEERQRMAVEIRDFLLSNKLWDVQVDRLIEWLEALVVFKA